MIPMYEVSFWWFLVYFLVFIISGYITMKLCDWAYIQFLEWRLRVADRNYDKHDVLYEDSYEKSFNYELDDPAKKYYSSECIAHKKKRDEYDMKIRKLITKIDNR